MRKSNAIISATIYIFSITFEINSFRFVIYLTDINSIFVSLRLGILPQMQLNRF